MIKEWYKKGILLSSVKKVVKRPWKGAYLFSPQFPRHCRRRRLRRIMVSLEYLPYY